MYSLRETTKNPSHLQGEMGERRERNNILGTPSRKEDDSKAIVPAIQVQQEPNVPHVLEQWQPRIPDALVQQRAGDVDQPIEGPAFACMTDTMKIVIVLEIIEQSFNPAEYLDLDQEEMNDASPLLATEKSREAQYEEDADAITQIMGRFAMGLTTKAEKEAEMEEIFALNKRHLAEAAPVGYLVQLRDVRIAQDFVKSRAPDSRSCKRINNALSRHVGMDYSYETVGALVVEEER